MIRLSALNDDSSEESEPERTQESIKQAQEAEALDLYNKALQYQQSGDHSKAEDAYNNLLKTQLVKEAPPPDDEEGLHKPGQVLKYSAYKNLAALAETRGELEKATDAYLEAVVLDDSDVTVWYHIGKVATKCYNLGLARQAFQEGLRCNPKHWLCLSELCAVLYAIGDYASCLIMIAEALERDEYFVKGLALRDKIFSEEPYLRKDFQHLSILFVSSVDDDCSEEAAMCVKEALSLREERLKLVEECRKEPPPLEPSKPLTSYTWASLGECFVSLYDHLTSPDNPQSLARRVNLESYYKAIVTPDISMPHKASLAKMTEQIAASRFSTEGFHVYKTTGQPEGDDKPKKVTKRKKPPPSNIESDFFPKRRSARVRTNKKEEEKINYKDLIQAFLPFPLRPGVFSGDDESSQDSLSDRVQGAEREDQLMASSSGRTGKDAASPYEGVISGEAETLDILTFVKEHMNNSGIINLMVQYGICLAAQRNKKWPAALADVLLKVYTRVRKHVALPPEFHRDNDEVYAGKLAKLIVVATELTLDKLVTAKSKSSSSLSPASSPRGGATGVSPIRVGLGFSSKFLATDIEYLHCIALDRTIHGDSWLEMAIRVNWAKARYLMLQGQMDIAMIYLDRCTKLLAVEVSPLSEPITVKLVNCKIDNNVTLEHVQKKLESLQRCQSLEEVHRLYEQGNYEDVVQLLMPTLHQPQPKAKVSELGMSIPERPAQLLLLQDSLIKLRDYKKCLMCSEVALNEAVSQMTPCEAWSTTLFRLFQCIDTCITNSKESLGCFLREKLLSLTLNIIKVIEASIYSSDNSLEAPLATAFPWTLLYKIIKHNEKEETADMDTGPKPIITTPVPSDPLVPSVSATKSDSNLETASVASDLPAIPASLQFMHTAHDHLGRRGWCCNSDGIFLLLYVKALTTEITKRSFPAREELVRDLEQCFLCLYGHPSKKAKARGLQEHNSCQIPLTWDNSAVVFDYFKPQELPTFDSKTNTISTEVQNLMRRITVVVPQHELEAITFDSVQAFIEGTSDDVPKLPERLVGKKRPVVSELFYLLADFYFKNKEFSKALKFYMHDVCVQPDRSDSWAAMALARKSRLENKLNACEPKSEGPIQKHSIAALRCFKRAMETDSTNSSILEEYGSLCYFLHAHASRTLKQFDQVDASVDTRSSLSQRKQEMLLLSEKCFTTALGMEDSEAWLHHYMLGKIAEKLRKPPQVYLTQYEKSAKYLDDDIASYPRKIPFYSPPEHVLEALEVYYRIHVSVLKLLMNRFPDIDSSLLEEYLQRAARGPFYNPEYDVDTGQTGLYRTESTTSETFISEPEPPEGSNLDAARPVKHETALSTIAEHQKNTQDSARTTPATESQETNKDVITDPLGTKPEEPEESKAPVPMETKDDDKPVTIETGEGKAVALETKDEDNSVTMDTKEDGKKVTLEIEDEDTAVTMEAEDSKEVAMETKREAPAGKELPNMETTSSDVTSDVTMKDGGDEDKQSSAQLPQISEAENVISKDDKRTESLEKDLPEISQGQLTTKDEVMAEVVEQKPTEENKIKDEEMVVEKESPLERDRDTNSDKNNEELPEAKELISKENKKEVTILEKELPESEKAGKNEEQEKMDLETKDDAKPRGDNVTELSTNQVEAKGHSTPLTAEQKARQKELMDRCIRALEHCLRRFPQHHKSRYRLAFVAYYSEAHKDLSFSQDLLLASSSAKPKPGRPVHQGLFNEKSKTNMFSSFWRIPEEDIDRPGSFCTHTYKSVDLLLRVLRDSKEWDILLLVSNLLYLTPVAGKKFLRDNERHFQARNALDYAFTIMAERAEKHQVKDGKQVLTQLVLDAYECWKIGQKYELFAKVTDNILSKAYGLLKAALPIGSDTSETSDSLSLLEQALRFCQQTAKPQILSTPSSATQSTVESSVESQADLTSEQDSVINKGVEEKKESGSSTESPAKGPSAASVISATTTTPSAMELDPSTPIDTPDEIKDKHEVTPIQEIKTRENIVVGVPRGTASGPSTTQTDSPSSISKPAEDKKSKEVLPVQGSSTSNPTVIGVPKGMVSGPSPMEVDPPNNLNQDTETKDVAVTQEDKTAKQTPFGVPRGATSGPSVMDVDPPVSKPTGATFKYSVAAGNAIEARDDDLKSSQDMQKTASEAIKMFTNLVSGAGSVEITKPYSPSGLATSTCAQPTGVVATSSVSTAPNNQPPAVTRVIQASTVSAPTVVTSNVVTVAEHSPQPAEGVSISSVGNPSTAESNRSDSAQ